MLTKTFFQSEQLHIYRYKGLEILIDHAASDVNGRVRLIQAFNNGKGSFYKRLL